MTAYVPLVAGGVFVAAGVFDVKQLTGVRYLRWLEGIFGPQGPRIGSVVLGALMMLGYFYR